MLSTFFEMMLSTIGPRGRFSNFPANRNIGKPPLDGLIVDVMAIFQ